MGSFPGGRNFSNTGVANFAYTNHDPVMTSFTALKLVAAISCCAMIAGAQDKPAPPAQRYFTDVELIDQTGAKVRLYSDLLKGKVVVINAFFTTCKDSCPVMAGNFAAIQEHFRERMGKDLFLLSFSVDPETDTPAVLGAYARRFHAGPGWSFLTGPKPNVDLALFKLGQKVDRKEDHLNVFLVGNDKTGLWKKVF
ncbi:MAG TPA: SCO family protein, partial [Bryobacteraceae bacterium]